MNKALSIAVLNLLIYIVEYLNNISMIWHEEKADRLLDEVKDQVAKIGGSG